MLPPCVLTPTAWHLSVGICIGILGLLVVLVPLLRDKLGKLEKAIWTLVLTVCLFFEWHSITLEDAKNERERAFSRCEELHSFEAIAAELGHAITGINKNLETATFTFQQTRPHSEISVVKEEFYGSNNPLGVVPFGATYKNSGSDPAYEIHILSKTYVASSDQRIAEQEVIAGLSKEWKEHLVKSTAAKVLAVGEEHETASPPLPINYIHPLTDIPDKALIYYVFRTQYRDKTGTWGMEHCSVTSNFHANGGFKHCNFLNNPRHKVK